MDNIEILQRIEKLEKQVELLQVEINAIKSIDVSEKTREQIDKIERANKLVSLMENLSGEKMPEAQKNEELEVLKNISQQAEIEVQSSMNIIDEFIDNSADESDFEWQSYQDGIEITKYIGFNKETVIVPELINNLPVRKIGDEVFLNCKEMHHIILPETIVELGKSVFEGSGLKEISLPSQIHKIPEYAFCLSDVSVVKCPPDIEEIDNAVVEVLIEVFIRYEGLLQENCSKTKLEIYDKYFALVSKIVYRELNNYLKDIRKIIRDVS